MALRRGPHSKGLMSLAMANKELRSSVQRPEELILTIAGETGSQSSLAWAFDDHSPANTLIVASEESLNQTPNQLCCTQIPDPHKLWDKKCLLFKVTTFGGYLLHSSWLDLGNSCIQFWEAHCPSDVSVSFSCTQPGHEHDHLLPACILLFISFPNCPLIRNLDKGDMCYLSPTMTLIKSPTQRVFMGVPCL